MGAIDAKRLVQTFEKLGLKKINGTRWTYSGQGDAKMIGLNLKMRHDQPVRREHKTYIVPRPGR